MRILMLTPQLPYPPDKGTRIRNFGLIKELSRRHDVSVISFAEMGDAAAVSGLERFCRVLGLVDRPRRRRLDRAWRTFLDPVPDLARRLSSPALTRRVGEALESEPWDILQVEALEMAPHWLAQRASSLPPCVLDEHNAEWVLQLRAAEIDGRAGRIAGAIYSRLQALKLKSYEGRAVRRADAVVAVSTEDARAIRAAGEPRRTAIAANGVDTEALAVRLADPGGETVLFTGTMDFRPNIDAVTWFARQVWPRVRAVVPGARFVVAGRSPTAEIRALDRTGGVEVTGAVHEMEPLFRRATIYAAPLRIGGGVRLKLLEAFAYGVPVVSTRLGAEGIAAVDGRELVIADEPVEIADAVVSLLSDAERRRCLAGAARDLVERTYDWRVIVPTLERLYGQLANTDGSAVASE